MATVLEIKDEPTRLVMVDNCIVFKVQDLCTKIQLCWPQHPKETREQRKGTNSGEESDNRKVQNREN